MIQDLEHHPYKNRLRELGLIASAEEKALGEAVEQFTHRSGGCPVLGNIQGQVGQGSEYLLELWLSMFVAGELDWMTFECPFQFK